MGALRVALMVYVPRARTRKPAFKLPSHNSAPGSVSTRGTTACSTLRGPDLVETTPSATRIRALLIVVSELESAIADIKESMPSAVSTEVARSDKRAGPSSSSVKDETCNTCPTQTERMHEAHLNIKYPQPAACSSCCCQCCQCQSRSREGSRVSTAVHAHALEELRRHNFKFTVEDGPETPIVLTPSPGPFRSRAVQSPLW